MDYDNDQKARIKADVKRFNKTIDDADENLLEYSIEVVIDRALLYLNHNTLAKQFEKVVADVVNSIFIKYKKNEDNADVETVVASVSDNGQSITYANDIKRYLSTASDNELFSGFTGILSRYRRIKVVTSK